MKKISLVIPDLYKGGMERVMSELANYFSEKSDCHVDIVILSARSIIFYKVNENISLYKPNFYFNNKYRLLSLVRTFIFLRTTIKKIKPDAILCFGETYNSFLLLSLFFLNFRIFVSDRSRPDKKWGKFYSLSRKMLYPSATGIISQTNYSKNFLYHEIGHHNIKVIPNPVRPIHVNSTERKNIILTVGRLIESKRIDLLLQIFSKCDNEGWELWIVGDDEKNLQDKLVIMAKELKINNQVKFWGKQEKIDKFYSMAKIFAFTSESEGLPNVILEAMSAGLPCISFNCIAGPADIISNNVNGYLVDLYDIDDYTRKLNFLIQNKSLRENFSLNAQKKSIDFNINIIGEKYYQFLMHEL